jgi:hypothetical protein
MLNMTKHLVRVAHLNVRTEFHGEDEVTMVDLTLIAEVANFELDKLSPTLRESLFDGDPDMLGADENPLVHPKNPELGALRWKAEFDLVVLRLHAGAKAKDDIVFGDAKIKKIGFEPEEGGTCKTVYQIAVQPTEDQGARLMMLLGRDVRISLEACEQPEESGVENAE